MNSGREDLALQSGLPIEQITEALATDGVAIIPGFVPEDMCRAVRDVVEDFKSASQEASSWYRDRPLDDGLVPVHQHQALWNVRQLPQLYALFRALLASPFLWTSIDRVSFKPPYRASHPEWRDNSPFHWDIDPRMPSRRLQALVYLDDCEPEQGPFQCVPNVFRHPDPWWSIYGVEPFAEERIRPSLVHRVPGPVGSLVLWDARLPHGSGLNTSLRPRQAMYVSMHREGDAGVRAERVRNFENRRAPAFMRGLAGQMDPEPGPTATLSELGERLLGRQAW